MISGGKHGRGEDVITKHVLREITILVGLVCHILLWEVVVPGRGTKKK